MPAERPEGFVIRRRLVVALPAREPEAELTVSHDWVEVDVQERVLDPVPVFLMTIDWEEVAVDPEVPEKLREVEVVTFRMALWTVTLEVAVEVLFEVS